jgi:hypothetical protein
MGVHMQTLYALYNFGNILLQILRDPAWTSVGVIVSMVIGISALRQSKAGTSAVARPSLKKITLCY